MLSPATDFPYPGSYALFADPDLAYPQPTELVRIMWRRVDSDGRGFVAVSFPLRDGAGGNKVVPAGDLIDATPLDDAETREFHDLDRALAGRLGPSVGEDGGRTGRRNLSKRQRARAARRDALRSRMIWSRFMAAKLAEMRRRDEFQRRAA